MKKIKETAVEVIYAIMPITLLVIVMQILFLRLPVSTLIQFLISVLMVSLGLILFLVGVHIGLLPIGELVGSSLPKTGKVWLVIFFGFLLGFVITVAEPDVRVLAIQVDIVSQGVITKHVLIYAVALGVAISVGLSMLRIILNIPIQYLLTAGYTLVFVLASFTPFQFVPISFDAGGVTTGPMTVPFILALGIGVSAVLGGRSSSTDGFGLVALASIGPIIAVLLLGVIYV